ncbi:YdeI/OmpD-associated family protein [Motilibacter deserti]|uniref:Bacteriocin resistance YdeI/OmpD-like protein n=1 Tax=Motilibacter deserti TaxID=2714956 RepID=A0ABX0H225_9ACTN|nr:YdeI/OmpD-associated family protein [Motilibacter deserti]NHC15990.1 hypothetical protein [Motilibacter deserti]
MTDAAPPERQGLPVVAFADASEWEAWLEREHASCPGVWVRLAKKGSGIASVSYAEAVEGALCQGWIDGQSASMDEATWLQKFTPRRARSKWSKINCERVEGLVAAGRMRPAGLAEVERAKADGRWDAAYDPPSTATVPADLQAALDADPAAAAAFASLNASNRYAILHRLHDAKKPETRARRLEKFVQMLRDGQKLHP